MKGYIFNISGNNHIMNNEISLLWKCHYILLNQLQIRILIFYCCWKQVSKAFLMNTLASSTVLEAVLEAYEL